MKNQQASGQKYQLYSQLNKLTRLFSQMGAYAGAIYLIDRFLWLPRVKIRLQTPLARFPLWCRLGTSDISTFRTVLGSSEYSPLPDLDGPILILDCGANVGYSSAYFLSRFTNSFVIAVEPDSKNYEMLLKNLAPYEGRYKAIKSAVWSKRTLLQVVRWPGGSESGIQVREVNASDRHIFQRFTVGDPFQSLSIADLIADAPQKRVSILKIDIECAEAEVFARDYDSWLSRVDNIAIELHDDSCRQIFSKAIGDGMFHVSQSGELTICRRACTAASTQQ